MASKRGRKSGRSGSLSGLAVLVILFGLFTFRHYILIFILIAAAIFIVRKLCILSKTAKFHDSESGASENFEIDTPLQHNFGEDTIHRNFASPASVSVRTYKNPEDSDTLVNRYAFLPDMKDGCHLTYQYRFFFDITDYEAILKYVKSGNWVLNAQVFSDSISLFAGSVPVGVLSEKADMLSDWIHRGDPYHILVDRVSREGGCSLLLGFYRDNIKYFANREQSVISLTAYKSEAKQDSIRFLKERAMVHIEPHESRDNVAVVTDGADPIGNLPKKAAERFFAEEIVFAVVDHIEERDTDDGDTVLAPYIRLYFE